MTVPLVGFTLLVFSIAATAVMFGGSASAGCGGAVQFSGAVPKRFQPIYPAAADRYGLGPQGPGILAAIHRLETGFGTFMGPSSAGAVGQMQFLPSSWAAYGVDGDHDGVKDPDDPWDAIFAAARLLRASGAPKDWHGAIFSYNHAEWYVDEVLGYARTFAPTSTSATLCAGAGTGNVKILPGANRAGVPLAQVTLDYLAKVAGIAAIEIRVGTGSNHSEYTTSGTVSDHWDGHAADIPTLAYGKPDSDPLGDRIMAACLIAGGASPAKAEAEAEAGGLYTLYHGGLRIQCIWKTYEGGDHYNHVHVGAAPG